MVAADDRREDTVLTNRLELTDRDRQVEVVFETAERFQDRIVEVMRDALAEEERPVLSPDELFEAYCCGAELAQGDVRDLLASPNDPRRSSI